MQVALRTDARRKQEGRLIVFDKGEAVVQQTMMPSEQLMEKLCWIMYYCWSRSWTVSDYVKTYCDFVFVFFSLSLYRIISTATVIFSCISGGYWCCWWRQQFRTYQFRSYVSAWCRSLQDPKVKLVRYERRNKFLIMRCLSVLTACSQWYEPVESMVNFTGVA